MIATRGLKLLNRSIVHINSFALSVMNDPKGTAKLAFSLKPVIESRIGEPLLCEV